MFFRGRGTTYLAERDDNGVIGPAIAICQDALSIALATEAGEHINRCGVIDAPDLRYPKSTSGTITLSYSEVEDLKFAIGVLGQVNAAQSPGTVTDEVLPDGLVAGDVYFLGGLERHRAITGLTVDDSDSPANTAAVTTNYTLDAASGRLTIVSIVGLTQPLKVSYGYTDPASVSLLSVAQKQYVLFFEFFNLVGANDEGSLELYNVRFDPAQNMDFVSEDIQVMELTGTMLVDSSKPVDALLGQFGRRIL